MRCTYLEKCASHCLAQQSYKSFVETNLNKWMHFQHVLTLRVAANHRHVICKINGWKIPEHFFTDVYIFTSLYL